MGGTSINFLAKFLVRSIFLLSLLWGYSIPSWSCSRQVLQKLFIDIGDGREAILEQLFFNAAYPDTGKVPTKTQIEAALERISRASLSPTPGELATVSYDAQLLSTLGPQHFDLISQAVIVLLAHFDPNYNFAGMTALRNNILFLNDDLLGKVKEFAADLTRHSDIRKYLTSLLEFNFRIHEILASPLTTTQALGLRELFVPARGFRGLHQGNLPDKNDLAKVLSPEQMSRLPEINDFLRMARLGPDSTEIESVPASL